MDSLVLFLMVVWLNGYANGSKPNYCAPPDNCWPTSTEIASLNKSINGTLISAETDHSTYDSLVIGFDLLCVQYPAWILIVNSVSDVKSGVTFAREHNMQITISSTGHSYTGRNSGNHSLMINMSQMKHYKFNSNDSLTVETGLKWGKIYEIINSTTPNNVIVGGADPDVGPGGWSLNGGHGPLSAAFGLGCDSILELYLVDATSNIVHVYNTSGIDPEIDALYWAMKGAGGSTFGVVLNITFKLHAMPTNSTFNVFHGIWSFYQNPFNPFNHGPVIANDVLNHLFEYVNDVNASFSSKWGGVLYVEKPRITMEYTYIGSAEDAESNIAPIANYRSESQVVAAKVTSYNTFWDFYCNAKPAQGASYIYIFSDLIPRRNLSHQFTNEVVSFVTNNSDDTSIPTRLMTAIIVQGDVQKHEQSALNNGWRDAFFIMANALAWIDPNDNNHAVGVAELDGKRFTPFGNGAIYSNEENAECAGCDWQESFWGKNNYQTLLTVKNAWDPNMVFWCNHCVGDKD